MEQKLLIVSKAIIAGEKRIMRSPKEQSLRKLSGKRTAAIQYLERSEQQKVRSPKEEGLYSMWLCRLKLSGRHQHDGRQMRHPI